MIYRFKLSVKFTAFAFLASIAFLSFQKNAFNFSENIFFNFFDKYSESLVVGNIVAEKLGLDKKNWNLGFILDDGPLDPNIAYKIIKDGNLKQTVTFLPYKSHVGIQGIIFAKLYDLFGNPRVESLNSVAALLFSVVVATLSILYAKIYSPLFGLVFFVTMISSPWVISFARNLYWVPFTWFLPAVFSAFIYLYKGVAKRAFLLLCVALAVCLKSLAGYEYLTTITLFACSVFFAAPFFKNTTENVVSHIKIAGLVFMACLAGFFLALVIHAGLRGDSIATGLLNIYEMDVKRRTYGDPSQFGPDIRASLESSPLDVTRMYWSEWYTDLALHIPGDYLGALFGFFLLGIIYKFLTRREFDLRPVWIACVFFAVTASWFILGKAHSFVHTQLNYVLWYFGFAQIILYFALNFLIIIFYDIARFGKKLGAIKTVFLATFIALIGMAVLPIFLDEKIERSISGPSVPLDVGSGFLIIFREDGKMVFFNPNCRDLDFSGFFILHIIPEEIDLQHKFPLGYENRDFVWGRSRSVWNPFSKYWRSCYKVVSLPNYRIKEFRTGQYSLKNNGEIMVRWDSLKNVPAMIVHNDNDLVPYRLTDKNWENGISRASAAFFVENSSSNRNKLRVGNKVLFSGSGTRTITDIHYTGQYINVFVKGEKLDAILDGYPNKVRVE